MLRSPTTHIVEIGTSTTKTTPTLLQKLHHANGCCAHTITTKYNCGEQLENNYFFQSQFINQKLHRQKEKLKLKQQQESSNRSTYIRSTCSPTVITSSPLLSIKENLTARSVLLFAPFAFMRSKKSKSHTQNTALLSSPSSPSISTSSSTKSESRSVVTPVDAFNGYGYDSKLALCNLGDCKSFMSNNNSNSCKNSINNNNKNNNNNNNKKSNFIYKITGKFNLDGSVIVGSGGRTAGSRDGDTIIQTQCVCIDNKDCRNNNNKNTFNRDKSNDNYNKKYINCANSKEICCKGSNTYKKRSGCVNNVPAAGIKFKSSLLSTKSSVGTKITTSEEASKPATASVLTSPPIITSSSSSVFSVLSYSAIVASPTVVTIAVLSPSIATITTTSTNTIATTMSPTSQTPPSSRPSLFDSCHRKIRLIGGGPVAFLGGLVAKARRKERDGDQNSTDTKLYLEESVLERKLPEADLKALVDLPAGLDYNEWLASHTLALFEHVNLVYGTISEFCTPTGCADMTGPGNRTYLWFDEKGKKTRVAAPQYIDYVMTFTQKTVSDESIFPTKYANEFPSSFESITRKILRLQFHVIAHLYATHFREIALLGLHTHLNLTFAHLTALHRRFNLIDEKETDVLRDLEVALRLTDDGNSSVSQNDSNAMASAATITTAVVASNGVSREVGNKQGIVMEDVNLRAQCNNINESNHSLTPPICSQPEVIAKSHQQQHQQQFRNIGLMGGILGDLSTSELNYCTSSSSSSSIPATISSSTTINSFSSTATASTFGYATDTISYNNEVAPLHNNFSYNTSKNNTNNNNNISNNNNNNNQYHNYHQHHHNLVHHVHTHHHHNHYTPNSGLIQCNATNAPNSVNNTTSTTTA